MSESPNLRETVQRIGALLERLEAAKEGFVQDTARELLQGVLEFHAGALRRVVSHMDAGGEAGQQLLARLAQDEHVSSVLLLHGLHPDDVETRVKRALDQVRPYLRSHRGDVTLDSISNGVVHLRLEGTCHGCPSSATTMKLSVEDAIYDAAPEVLSIEAVGAAEPHTQQPSDFVPLARLRGEAAPTATEEASSRWQDVDGASFHEDGQTRAMMVDGRSILMCRIAGVLYAYSDRCPGCAAILSSPAEVVGDSVRCPSCRERFDLVRAGRGLDDPSHHLQPFPLIVEAGKARVAIPARRPSMEESAAAAR